MEVFESYVWVFKRIWLGFGSSQSQMFLAFYDDQTKIRVVKNDGSHIYTSDVGSGQRWSSSFSYSTDS